MTGGRLAQGGAEPLVAEPRAGPLLARAAELAVWQERLRAGRDGAGSVLVLTGEAGIGKSRLVEEFLATVGEPVHVLLGSCPPVAGSELPYAPVLQALRALRPGLPEPEQQLVAGWLPGPPADPVRDGPADAAQGSRSAQVRFFEGLTEVLLRLSAQRLVVFVVEDLHWADRSTVDLLSYLANGVRSERLLLVLTTRDDLPRDHPQRRVLAELTRLPQTRQLPLTRLSRDDTGALLELLAGRLPTAELVDAVFGRAEGNPLFTRLLLPEAVTGAAVLPPVLRDLLTSRFTQLSPTARRLLQVACTVGRHVRDDLLSRVAGLPDGSVDAALRELVDRQVLRPEGDGFAFVHELVREAAYDELLPGERRRLHGRLAEVLSEGGEPSGPAVAGPGEAAHHFLAAGRWAEALPLSVEAGLAAQRSCAFAEALTMLLQADAAWDRLEPPGRTSPLPRAGLLASAAHAADLLGDDDRAVELVTRALAALDPDDPVERARLHERRGTYHFNAGDEPSAQGDLLTALHLLPADQPSVVRAAVLASLALLAMAWTRLDEAGERARAAIDAARLAGSPKQEGRARNALGVVLATQGELDAGVAELQSAVALARAVDDPDDVGAATINLGHVLGVAGRYDEAVRTCLEGYSAAQASGLEREHGSFLLANAADSLLRSGRWEEADTLLAQARERSPRGLRAFTGLLQSTWLAARRGEHEVALARLEAARALLTEASQASWRLELLEVAAELYAGCGRADDAAAAVDEALGLVELTGEPQTAGPLVLSGLRAAADEAERADAGRDPDAADRARRRGEALHERAGRLAPSPVVPGAGRLPEAPAVAAACAGELGRLRGRPDPDAWLTAERTWAGLHRPYEQAYAAWRAAEALLATDRAEQGEQVLLAGHALAVQLGAGALADELAALASWRRVPLQVLEAAPPDAAQSRLGLTSRELEVLTRVTAGQTNRQIAAELFISSKTASVHVSNILRKLDVSRRQDAARIGRQIGLIPRPRHA